MLEEQARVTAVKGQTARLEVLRQHGCQGCTLSPSCGVGALGRLLGYRGHRVNVENTLDLKKGDKVVLALPDHSYLLASVLIYLLPLLSMFLLAGLLDWFRLPEPWIALGAVAGLGIGLLASGRLARVSFGKSLQPKMLRRLF